MEGARRTKKVKNSSKDLHFSWDRTPDDGKRKLSNVFDFVKCNEDVIGYKVGLDFEPQTNSLIVFDEADRFILTIRRSCQP